MGTRRVWGIALALVAITGAALSSSAEAGYYLTVNRWGSAMAAQGSLQAIVTITDVQVQQDDPDQPAHPRPYVCVSLRDPAADRAADTCVEADFTFAADFSAAHAAGSAVADLYRASDHARLGPTVIHYDVRWERMDVPLARVQGGAEACPRVPWAPEYAGASATPSAELYSFGSAAGSMSSGSLGAVTFSDQTLLWVSALGHAASVGVWEATDALPVATAPGCRRATVLAGVPLNVTLSED